MSRGLYLTLSRPVSGQHRPSTVLEFSRIGPKPALRPRGEFIPAWIRFTTKGEARRRELSGGCRRLVVESDPCGRLAELCPG